MLDEMARLAREALDTDEDGATAEAIHNSDALYAFVTPARILALVAAARQGAEDTRLLREQSCEIGVRAAIGAIENTQARDAANAVLQDRYGAPAIQAALILRATTPSEATDA